MCLVHTGHKPISSASKYLPRPKVISVDNAGIYKQGFWTNLSTVQTAFIVIFLNRPKRVIEEIREKERRKKKIMWREIVLSGPSDP